MTFRENANISTGRARRGGGGGGGMAVGGGIGGLLLVLLVMLFGGDPGAVLGGGGSQAPSEGQYSDLDECQTGADANANVDCRIQATMLSLEDYWTEVVPELEPTTATIFTGQVNTQCGTASSQVGPFYCPVDQGIYLDSSF